MKQLCVSDTHDVVNPALVSFSEREKQLQAIESSEKAATEREKRSPYSNWYQFNRDHTAEMIWLTTNHPKAQAILLFLLDQMDTYNAVLCSYTVLQEALGMSQATVARSIKVLKDGGYIAIAKSGTSNVYIVNKALAWGSWGKNFQYCKFPANVVLSATENKELLDTVKTSRLKAVEMKLTHSHG